MKPIRQKPIRQIVTFRHYTGRVFAGTFVEDNAKPYFYMLHREGTLEIVGPRTRRRETRVRGAFRECFTLG